MRFQFRKVRKRSDDEEDVQSESVLNVTHCFPPWIPVHGSSRSCWSRRLWFNHGGTPPSAPVRSRSGCVSLKVAVPQSWTSPVSSRRGSVALREPPAPLPVVPVQFGRNPRAVLLILRRSVSHTDAAIPEGGGHLPLVKTGQGFRSRWGSGPGSVRDARGLTDDLMLASPRSVLGSCALTNGGEERARGRWSAGTSVHARSQRDSPARSSFYCLSLAKRLKQQRYERLLHLTWQAGCRRVSVRPGSGQEDRFNVLVLKLQDYN